MVRNGFLTWNILPSFKASCQLYGINTSTTDEARYKKFCHSTRTPEPQQLPPTSDALLCHCNRVNYVTKVTKSSLNSGVNVPNPDGYVWCMVGGKLEIQWFVRDAAPESVLNLVACVQRIQFAVNGPLHV